MWNAVRAQAWSDVGVQDSKAPDHSAIPVGEQRDPDPVFLREMPERFLGIVTNRRNAEAFRFDHRTGLFQLDQLGSAVASPIGASVENEEQAIGTSELRDGSQDTLLVRQGEIRYVLAGLGACRVAIVGGVDVPGLQLFGNRLSSGTKPSKLPHDCGFFLEVIRDVVRHRQSSTATIPPLRLRELVRLPTRSGCASYVGLPDKGFVDVRVPSVTRRRRGPQTRSPH